MAAEITLFEFVGANGDKRTQVAGKPYDSKTATFTPTRAGVARVYANGAAVALTVNSITWTVPSGTVEYFCLEANAAVTVA